MRASRRSRKQTRISLFRSGFPVAILVPTGALVDLMVPSSTDVIQNVHRDVEEECLIWWEPLWPSILWSHRRPPGRPTSCSLHTTCRLHRHRRQFCRLLRSAVLRERMEVGRLLLTGRVLFRLHDRVLPRRANRQPRARQTVRDGRVLRSKVRTTVHDWLARPATKALL